MATAPKTKWPADKIERRTVSELVPYARNARIHKPDQIQKLADSIEEWGWPNPVLVDEDGMILAGHGRVLAAAQLEMTDVPVMVAAGWTDAQKQAYVIADNKLAEGAGWDDALLYQELADLQTLGFDTALTGLEAEPTAVDLDPTQPAIQRVPVDRVNDQFWIAISGPLAHQDEALAAFKALNDKLPRLEIEMGTVKRDG